ncbi:hypothetical protein [Acinetobacter sp. ZOR0008]|uniref:hypothetical protein n=1 Tax=Acinetobacter sp. ZOR0008 TaxID=1339229 RepID=UPI0006459CA4|nr:hypothetical protein [Acinetobacter sp. ZOR0008]
MRQFTSLRVALLTLGSLCFSSAYAASTLVPMSDSELSATRGQALMSMSYIAPNDSANLEKLRDSSSNVGFYKLGLEAELEINANIRKLQLGCGGVNGAGGCDIDFDNVSLSGVADTREGRVASDAKLTNPFFELAIKNPNSASTREVAGIRLSAEAVEGLLTIGTENSATPNGINSLSGYMVVAPQVGAATVEAARITQTGSPACGVYPSPSGCGVNQAITGKARGEIALGAGFNLDFQTKSYDITLSPTQKAQLSLPQSIVSGHRMSSVNLLASAIVNGIDLSGTLAADVDILGGITLNGNLRGTINNLPVTVPLLENLGYIHKIDLSGSPLSLSMQGQDIRWPGTVSTAMRGWWLELSNPIGIGRIDPTNSVVIKTDTIRDALTEVSKELTQNPLNCGFLAVNCIGGDFNVGTRDLSNARPAVLELQNLQLANQSFAPNCYGSLKFC